MGQGKIAIVQVTVPITYKTYVFHLHAITGQSARSRILPEGLTALLENVDIAKVGCGISTDVAKFQADYKVTVASAVDIAVLARDKGLYPRGRASLDELCTFFLRAGVLKGAFRCL